MNRRNSACCFTRIESGKSSSISSRPASSCARYRIKSVQKSEVDESLFGRPSTAKNSNNNALTPTTDLMVSGKNNNMKFPENRCVTYSDKPKRIRVITNDHVKTILIGNKKKDQAIVLPSSEFNRLMNYTIEEKPSMDADRKRKEKESIIVKRRQFFHRLDMERSKIYLSENEKERLEESKILNKKAWENRMSGEEEIRVINNMIKEAKLEAIREKQIAEKLLMEQERLEEEKIIDQRIEEERQKQVAILAERDRKRLEKEYISAHSMYQQIAERNQNRLDKLEEDAKENIRIRKEMEDLIVKDATHVQKEARQKLEINKQIQAENIILMKFRDKDKEEEKELEAKVLKYQLEKEAREKELERIQEEKNKQREIEYCKYRTAQKREQDFKSMRDELLEKRSWQEEERKWRQKELEEAVRKKEAEQEVQTIREVQKYFKLLNNAAEAKKEQKEFEYNINYVKSLISKVKEEEELKQSKKQKYAKELMDQLVQRKRDKVVDCYRRYEEDQAVWNDIENRKLRLEEMKRHKIEELENSGLNEKFITRIKQRIKNPLSMKKLDKFD